MDRPDDIGISLEQRDFWDSLQMDIINSNQELSIEDYRAFIERSFMFSIFFRGCTAYETIGFKKMLDLKDNGYLILLDFYEADRSRSDDLIVDEFKLHHFIKKIFRNKDSAVGPLITNHISILITQDVNDTETAQREESTALCQELLQELEKQFKVKVKACIGSTYNIYSIYSSFIDTLACLNYNSSEQIVYFPDIKRLDPNIHFDYPLTEKHLLEAVRLRKIEAYHYFSMLMESIRPLDDEMKRNKILELLILANHSLKLDSQEDLKQISYIVFVQKLMSLSGNQLIEYAYQQFNYLTSYVKPQNSIDYSNHIVKATKAYLENHYTDDVSLESMAEHVSISPQYFSKLIKKTTGFNFIDWLSMLRVKKAKELLTNSDLTVKEVCFMVGYKDPNYFSRIFKKRIGITPSEYVKANSFNSKS